MERQRRRKKKEERVNAKVKSRQVIRRKGGNSTFTITGRMIIMKPITGGNRSKEIIKPDVKIIMAIDQMGT